MTLYHYCSTEAFRSILGNRSVWLSSLISSNDALEGKWITTIIDSLAKTASIEDSDRARLIDAVKLIDDAVDCLGFCLSKDGDTLSQWRGYADDGRGVSIGFNEAALKRMVAKGADISFQEVTYEILEQKRKVRPHFTKIKSLVNRGVLHLPLTGSPFVSSDSPEAQHYLQLQGELVEVIGALFPMWFSMKNPAFREEREWRLAKLILPPYRADYRTSNGRLIPFTPVSFPDAVTGPVIDKIYLGPKHPTPRPIVLGFLKRFGYEDVEVIPSEASYR